MCPDKFFIDAIKGFIADPPDSDFQRGMLCAYIEAFETGCGKGDWHPLVVEAKKLMPRGSYKRNSLRLVVDNTPAEEPV